MTPHEKELLTALRNAGADASVAEILRRNDLASTHEARKKLSSQLCKLREKGLAVSHQQDGVNYWSWTLKGLTELGDIPPDMPAPEIAPESPEIQADAPDILSDISVSAELPTPAPPPVAPESKVALILVQESIRLPRPFAPFYDLDDALFVLDTLATICCQGIPSYQTEITRIADYLREAAA